MLIAHCRGQRLTATDAGKGAVGRCAFTGREVKTRIGSRRAEWYYPGGAPDLPPGVERDTEFHHRWKSLVPSERCEVILRSDEEGFLLADIVVPDEAVVNLFAGSVPSEVLSERAKAYDAILPGHKQLAIIDLSPIWKKTFNVGEIQHGSFGSYSVEKPARRFWFHPLAANPNVILYGEYSERDRKMLKIWVHKGELFCRFVQRADVEGLLTS